jgi:phage terminase large subunit-like protein
MFGLRLGQRPRVVVTTTPRPVKIIKELLAAATTHVTTGSTYENLRNLSPVFRDKVVARYEGTRLGRQELEGEVLEDAPGALWSRDMIEATRVDKLPPMRRVVVAVDPSVSNRDTSDECGLVVAGMGEDGHGYLMEDRTARLSPNEWAQRAVMLYHKHAADRIVAEVNNGGDLVEMALRSVDQTVAYTALHASRGKYARAEPVAALYEQSKIHHLGAFPELEDELCTYEAAGGQASPNRLDAVVWAMTELMLGRTFAGWVSLMEGTNAPAGN